MRRKRRWAAVAALVVGALATAGIAVSGNGSTNNKTFVYQVGLWGDLPYSAVQDFTRTFGEPQGVKLQGGIFEMVTREIEVECLPSEIPSEFRVDITELMIGKQLRAADVPIVAPLAAVTASSACGS